MAARPTDRDIQKKISDARTAIKEGRCQFGSQKHLAADLAELGVDRANQLWPLLQTFLAEIEQEGPISCYRGGRPPQRAYEPELKNLELWAYSWTSHCMGQEMYLKFAFKKGHYIHVDCHESRPPKGKKSP